MIKGIILFIFLGVISFSTFATNIVAINFQQKDEISFLDFVFDKENVNVRKFHVTDDKQIIVDITGVEASQRVLRAFDTSEFSGSVVFVSAYRKPDDNEAIRVVIQLRDNVRSKIAINGKRAVLQIENRFGVFAQRDLKQGENLSAKTIQEEKAVRVNVPKSESLEDILENLTLSGRKKYIGKKITLNVKNLPVSSILDMIADASGFNIIQSEDVTTLPKASLNLVKIPWDQVLDTVLKLNDLVAEKNGSILTIKTLAKATEERLAKEAAQNVKVKAEVLVTKIFPISYSKAKDVSTIFKDYLTKDRGALSIDERTNSVIVKDTQSNIEKMSKVLEFLDTQTPQVLIESKIVEVFESYAREIGLKQGVGFGYDPVGRSSSSRSIVGTASGASNNGGPGFSFSTAPTGVTNAMELTIGRFGRLFNLDFKLQLLESESKGKVVASPRVVTKHNVKAQLISKEQTSYVKTEGTGDSATSSFEPISATLDLTVTPLVTNDGSIDLQIELSKEQFGTTPQVGAPPDITTRKINTSVLVDNGSTIVLGGLCNYTQRENHSGIPFLKDIPLVGWLFRSPYNPSTSKQELVIFITPRIINQEKAGLVNTM